MPYMQLLAAWHLADLIVWRHLWNPIRLRIKELVPVRTSPQRYHLSLRCMFAKSSLRKPTLSLLMIVELGKPYLHLNTHLSCACLPALGVSLQKHKICLRCFSCRLWCDFPFYLHLGVVHLSQSPLPTRCAGEHAVNLCVEGRRPSPNPGQNNTGANPGNELGLKLEMEAQTDNKQSKSFLEAIWDRSGIQNPSRENTNQETDYAISWKFIWLVGRLITRLVGKLTD